MKPFKLFGIKPEERIQALVALVLIIVLNALFIWRMHDLFMQEGFGPYWKTFERELHLSGYDPLTYLRSIMSIVTRCWRSLSIRSFC